MPPSSQETKWSLSRGNGIGPEANDAVQRILDAARATRGSSATLGSTPSTTARIQASTSSTSKVQRTLGSGRRPNNPLEVPMVQYRPRQRVPKSGIYRVVHDQAHIEAHDVTAVIGERFPPCHLCGQHPRFMLERAAHHLDKHPAFTRRATE